MIGRRKVLKLLGITPLAAKATAEKAAMSLTTLNGGNPPPIALGFNNRAGYPMSVNAEDSAKRYDRMAGYIRVFGKVPAHVERSAWEEAKYVTYLDPDLATMKSWSLAAKVHEQRQRNYKRKLEEYRDAGWYDRGAKLFKDTMGFDWSW